MSLFLIMLSRMLLLKPKLNICDMHCAGHNCVLGGELTLRLTTDGSVLPFFNQPEMSVMLVAVLVCFTQCTLYSLYLCISI